MKIKQDRTTTILAYSTLFLSGSVSSNPLSLEYSESISARKMTIVYLQIILLLAGMFSSPIDQRLILPKLGWKLRTFSATEES